MIAPRDFHRTARDASPVDRACAVESHRRRRGSARWFVVAAVLGTVLMVAGQIGRRP